MSNILKIAPSGGSIHDQIHHAIADDDDSSL